MGKNYVEEFMKENNLKFEQKFQVKGCSRDIHYYFTSSNKRLYIKDPEYKYDSLDNAMFADLLSGNEEILSGMEKAADALGVKLNKNFKIFTRDGKYCADFYLDNKGLKQTKTKEPTDIYDTNMLFMGLFTGDYYIR